MKRTRRIEITMYSRRVTVTHGSDATATRASELSALEVDTDMSHVIASVLEELNMERAIASQAAAAQLSRRRPLHTLRGWLRRCF
ncbi:MAG: hypothetical protein LC731_05185 [Acidobacteria bacterium]|nr:hypothetical protein [Acidobacteriota bacterium]